MTVRNSLYILGLSLFGLPLTGCPNAPQQDIVATIDTTVEPATRTRMGSDGPGRPMVSRPTGAVADSEGNTSTFILNEMVVTPESQEELDGLLARTGGRVVSDDAFPAEVNGVVIPTEYRTATTYIVRVDASRFPLDNFDADIEGGLGIGGEVRFASEAAQRLVAMIASEGARGIDVGPNFVFEGYANYLNVVEDHPVDTGGFENTLRYFPFIYDDTGSAGGIAAAWALTAMKNVTRRSRIAIIDGGFFLNTTTGAPMPTDSTGDSDYAIPTGMTVPLQWDTLGDDGTAGGPGVANCSGGSRCDWHGHGAAMAAAGVLNNQHGFAGSGGQVVDPILIKTDLTTGSVKEGLRMAAAMNADIVSMSFGGECDNVFCQFYYSAENYSAAFSRAKYRDGMLLLAAAGNDGRSARNKIPCRYNPSIMCIGSLNRDDNLIAGYSNYNNPLKPKDPAEAAPENYLQTVDLWAAAGIPLWGPNNDLEMGLINYFGTSASTPVVAGVAAMLKSADPTLTPTQLQNILESTAKTDSPSLEVERHLNAIDALRRVTGESFELDSNEPNGTTAPTVTNVGSAGRVDFSDVTLHTAGDTDYYLFRTTGWFGVNISTYYSRVLTDLDFVFMQVGRSSPPSHTAVEEFLDARIQRFSGLSPGEYLLAVRHRSTINRIRHRETFYDLFVDFTRESSPQADEYDRSWRNDSYSSRTRLGRQRMTKRVTHHQTSDVDFYEFEVDSLLDRETMAFTIRNSDYPLNLTLYNSTGAEVRSGDTTSISLSSGTWTIKVEQPDNLIGRYTFTASGAIPPTDDQRAVIEGQPDSFWRLLIEMGNIDWRVIRGMEYFLIPRGPRPDEFILVGNVNAALMDLEGNILTNATPVELIQIGTALSLSTVGAPNEDLLIQVSSTLMDPSIYREDEWDGNSFPEEPFSMFWNVPRP